MFRNDGSQKHLVRDTKGQLKRRMITGQRVRKGDVRSRIDR